MKALLIIGAGGHGRVVAEIAIELGYDNIVFLDDNSETAIGKIDEMDKFVENYHNAFCAIGNNTVRAKIFDRLVDIGYIIPSLIHPTAYVSEHAQIESGVVIEPGAIVNTGAHLHRGAIVSVGAIIDHDTEVGMCSHINAGAIVKAGGHVDDYTRIDAGCVVSGY